MASLKVYRAEAPYTVGLIGSLAGVAAAPSQSRGAVVAAELLGEEGIAVEVTGARGSIARAAEEAARRLLERLGEEARLRLAVETTEPLLLPEAHVAAAAARTVTELLGLEPAPEDIAEVLARATAIATGRPLAPVAAAAYYRSPVVAAEQPPAVARLPEAPRARLYVVPPCRGLSEPPVAVEASRHLQLVQAAATVAALAAARGWEGRRFWELVAQESPWDYAAPVEVREARRRALAEGALAAGIEPYSLAFIVIAEDEEPVAPAVAKLEAAWGCSVEPLELEPLAATAEQEEQ